MSIVQNSIQIKIFNLKMDEKDETEKEVNDFMRKVNVDKITIVPSMPSGDESNYWPKIIVSYYET